MKKENTTPDTAEEIKGEGGKFRKRDRSLEGADRGA